jgi:hypothetical protein
MTIVKVNLDLGGFLKKIKIKINDQKTNKIINPIKIAIIKSKLIYQIC